MLGHLKPKACHSNPEHKANYQEMYCSICASLRREDHVGYSFLLNHELTLLMLAFRPYLHGGEAVQTLCPAKAYLGTKKAQKHPAVALAGKLSIVLGWVKVTDWATDRPRFYKTWLKRILQRRVNRILPALPAETQRVIAHYLWLTQTNSTDFEEVRLYSGLLSEQLGLAVGEQTACLPADVAEIGSLFRLNGELISVADHLIDVEKDQARKEYNPILEGEPAQWLETYYRLRTLYNRLKINIYDKLSALQQDKKILPDFASMLQKAIQNMDAQIVKNKPLFADLPAEELQKVLPEYVRADCDCSGCDCSGCECGGCDCSHCSSCCDCCNCFEACGNCGTSIATDASMNGATPKSNEEQQNGKESV